MSRQQYEQMLSNPNVRKMLDLIAKTEGVAHGYNTLFGNQRIDNLSTHPNIRKQFKQTDGKVNYTTAAGRYQFLKPTWDDLVKKVGLSDFSPRSQDIGAIALLAQNGALPYVLKGDFNAAIQRSGRTWASLPSSPYAQPKKSWEQTNKLLGGNSLPPQQLKVSDLERKYGKGQLYKYENETPTQSGQLSVSDLERQYGKGKPYVFEGDNLSAGNRLTIADLEQKYGKGQLYQF
ncbi:glycoside hydrolase family 104 protein [Acinetobacter haemolyticus]|uniref:glycoside hydrolase family 24 protein n=1 Tax=Acinetobacter haemolyticus TaxID=29430 RepID=UPI00300A1A19